jgi:class 3 adenylate cyclase
VWGTALQPSFGRLDYGQRVSPERHSTLPEEPSLRQAAIALRASDQSGIVYDASWRIAFMTDAQARILQLGDDRDWMGRHELEFEEPAFWEMNRQYCLDFGGFVLADTAGGKDELRSLAAPAVRDLIDDMVPNHDCVLATRIHGLMEDVHVGGDVLLVRLTGSTGSFAGAMYIQKPLGDAYTLAAMTSIISPHAIAQIEVLSDDARRPAAILCADLDGSTPLSRRLPTASYFRLIRRWVFFADRCIVDAGGLVGRHAGDGVTAFFLAESLGSESAAAKASIAAARAIRRAAGEIANHSDAAGEDVGIRFGLHWGSTLYVGAINTQGRFEVTAMGDQVNEAARIEACASGGRTLASKDLVERLSGEDADALGLEVGRLHYVALGELSTATDKARRDAPVLAVCDV